MLYQVSITVPPDTPKERPVVKKVDIEEEVITRVTAYFPSGPCNLLKVSLWHGDLMIFPSRKYEWLSGEGIAISEDLYYDIAYRPYPVTIKAYNLDVAFEHSAIFYISAQPRRIVYLQDILWMLVRRLDAIIRFLGV